METTNASGNLRPKIACTECRKAKHKCKQQDDGKCSRCKHMGKKCIIAPPKTQDREAAASQKRGKDDSSLSSNDAQHQLGGSVLQLGENEKATDVNNLANQKGQLARNGARLPSHSTALAGPNFQGFGPQSVAPVLDEYHQEKEIAPSIVPPKTLSKKATKTVFHVFDKSPDCAGFRELSSEILTYDPNDFINVVLKKWGLNISEIDTIKVRLYQGEKGNLGGELFDCEPMETVFPDPKEFSKIKKMILQDIESYFGTKNQKTVIDIELFPKTKA